MNQIDIPQDPRVATKMIAANVRSQQLKAELGLLGRFFGSGENIRLYIVGLLAMIVLTIALVYTLTPEKFRSSNFGLKEMWTLVATPIVTTILGYLIGSGTKSKNNAD